MSKVPTNREILISSIRKALDNGWDVGQDDRPIKKVDVYDSLNDNFEPSWSIHLWYNPIGEDVPEGYEYRNYNLAFRHPLELIYDKSFTKALWTDDSICTSCGRIYQGGELWCRTEWCGAENRQVAAWLYHLQQMVISDDPIKYIGEHLDD